MLPKEMWDLLLSHHIPVIACGDPFQLPPIDPKTDNHVLDHPHIFLDEIMRQAEESEIIRLSMHIREMKPMSNFESQQQEVMILDEPQAGVYTWADQILCATNKTRYDLNAFMRKELNYPVLPQVDDKVIGLTNHWDCLSDQKNALTNGIIGKIENMEITKENIPSFILPEGSMDIAYLDFVTDDGERFSHVPVDYQFLMGNKKVLNGQQEYRLTQMAKRSNGEVIFPPYDFNYGYAITTHKAQGSEWNKVAIVEERFPFEKEEHARWLYTAVTRACQKVVLIRG